MCLHRSIETVHHCLFVSFIPCCCASPSPQVVIYLLPIGIVVSWAFVVRQNVPGDLTAIWLVFLCLTCDLLLIFYSAAYLHSDWYRMTWPPAVMLSLATLLTLALLIIIFWLVREFDFGGITFTFFFLSSLAMQCIVFLRARPPIPKSLLKTLKANIPGDDYAFLRIVAKSRLHKSVDSIDLATLLLLGTLLFVVSCVILVLYVVLLSSQLGDARSEVQDAGSIIALCIAVLDLLLLTSSRRTFNFPPFVICLILLAYRALASLFGERYWYLGLCVIYFLLGNFFIYKAIDRLWKAVEGCRG